MDSYTPPVGPRDPYERYRVESIEKDSQRSFDKDPDDPNKKKPALLALIVNLIRRLFQLLDAPILRKNPSTVRVHLRQFKMMLETLQNTDHSQDSGFLNHLSELWHELLDDQQEFPIIKSLLDLLQSYPPDQEHTLGYYLTEYVGQKWLPFPFMEMVLKLHLQHKKNPLSSTLRQWILQIDSLLTSLV